MRHPREWRSKGAKALDTSVARFRLWLYGNFPERQVYVRSSGHVQFFTFSSSLQAVLATLLLTFLGWTAFVTVNVVFKDHIILERDRRYLQAKTVYENRVDDLEMVNTELNDALVATENRFQASVRETRTEQTTLQAFLDRKRQADAILRNVASASVRRLDQGEVSPNEFAFSLAPEGGRDARGNERNVRPHAGPAHAGRDVAGLDRLRLELGNMVRALFGTRATTRSQTLAPDVYKRHPQLRVLAAETKRIQQINDGDVYLISMAQAQVAAGTKELRAVIGRTGIDPDSFVRRTTGPEGGPDIPLGDVHIDGLADANFASAYLRAAASLGQLDEFLNAIRHIPLAVPVSGPQFERTSGFGPRRDPFTGKFAFHPGIDFAGPLGSIVRATAPGRVVFAGMRGGYGNMVEIDHGFGLHTRYAHLEATLVKVGDQVAFGSPVGKLGSTGRSTGPHVHYEVWFDNVVRDPKNFIDAAKNQRVGDPIGKRNLLAR